MVTRNTAPKGTPRQVRPFTNDTRILTSNCAVKRENCKTRIRLSLSFDSLRRQHKSRTNRKSRSKRAVTFA